jgi:hypothetical protein
MALRAQVMPMSSFEKRPVVYPIDEDYSNVPISFSFFGLTRLD